MQMCDKFPSIKLRSLANAVSNTHIVIDKKKFEQALKKLGLLVEENDKSNRKR